MATLGQILKNWDTFNFNIWSLDHERHGKCKSPKSFLAFYDSIVNPTNFVEANSFPGKSKGLSKRPASVRVEFELNANER